MSVYIHVASKLRPSQLAVTVLDCLADSRGRHLVGDLDVALRREIGEQLWNDRQVAHLMAAQAEAASDVLERGAAEMAWLSSMPIMDCSSRHSGCRSGSWLRVFTQLHAIARFSVLSRSQQSDHVPLWAAVLNRA
jgi:hypothetical protein